jgi:mannose-1-phosphate guanylyltransferase
MKVVIFAGGVGTRLWPLSRKNTPKQFGKLIGDKSTLQQAVERLQPEFNPEDIYIATGKRYENIVTEQLPEIPRSNFIFEPEMRDVGPAIGLVTATLNLKNPNEPMGIIWSDHMVKDIGIFQSALRTAEKSILSKKSEFVFIGQKARFANQNVGWIHCGEKIEEKENLSQFEFKKLKYRPKLSQAEDFFQDEHYVWNLGYFVTTPSFLIDKFKKFVPEMHKDLEKIVKSKKYEKTLMEIYPTLEKISFDDAILEKFTGKNISVIAVDIGWSDIGAWEALKEALSETKDENVTKGDVMLEDSRDTLMFNFTKQLLVGIDLSEMLVINTEDVMLVCPKTSVPKIKKLVESLSGTPHEHLT